METSKLPEFLTTQEVANLLRTDRHVIRRMINADKLHAVRLETKAQMQKPTLRITRQSLLLYLASHDYSNSEEVILAACKALDVAALGRLIIKLSLYNTQRKKHS